VGWADLCHIEMAKLNSELTHKTKTTVEDLPHLKVRKDLALQLKAS